MKKHNLRPAVSVLFAAFALAISLVALLSINGSVAWFAENRQVEVGGLSVYVSENDMGFNDVQYYGIINISGSNYTFSESAPENLPTFDPEGIGYSEYKHALLISLTYKVSAGSSCRLTATCPSSAESLLFKTENHLSNAVQFRMASVSGEVATADATAVSFVTPVLSGATVTGVTKVNSIVLADGIPSEGTLYLIMEYNEPVVRYIGEQVMSIGEDDTDDMGFVTYAPYITLSLVEASAS